MKKLLHICMTSPYQPGLGYDENIMPFYHQQLGYKVFVVTQFGNDEQQDARFNDKGVIVQRVSSGCRFRDYLRIWRKNDFYESLVKIDPDVIYIHNAQFPGFIDVIRFVQKRNRIKLFVDNHDDYYNTSIHGVADFVLKRCIYRAAFIYSQKYVKVFWGVTPWRCQYLHEVFGVSKEKIKLLVMGADDRKIHFSDQDSIRSRIRDKYGIKDDDFLIVTGGKIDKTKNIHILMDAINELSIKHVKLIIFGSVAGDFSECFNSKLVGNRIVYVGWLDPDGVYDYYLSSDLAVFPGTHSILWEQACACGIPVVVKDWPSMHHVDTGGNAFFLKESSKEEIKQVLTELITDPNLYNKANKVAKERCTKRFSYSRISKKAISE